MHTATYSPDDNKLRLYPAHRLDAETYQRVTKAGFSWAAKQELFVASAWTPGREDLLLELCGEIDDEDKTVMERAEERADRFTDYSDKRAGDAERAHAVVRDICEHIPLGQPILVGHHSEARARKDCERIGNNMRQAVNMWSTSQYWTDRAVGVLRNAKYKERADVRARRIKKLEAEQRKEQAALKSARTSLTAWSSEGLADRLPLDLAKRMADLDRLYVAENGERVSVWSLLDSGKWSVAQAVSAGIEAFTKQLPRLERWVAHFEMRLSYERALLAAQGGTVADRTGPQVGGAVKCWASPRGGWAWIKKVNKVSVTIEDNWGNGGANFTRTIPFDKLTEIMTPGQVNAAREQGRLVEIPSGVGFVLTAAQAAA